MIDILEALMIFCFGISWPISIHKSWVSRTAKGKSLVFELFLWIGYICGIVRKFLQLASDRPENWVFYLAFVFYFINLTAITIDMILWVRNRKLDLMREVSGKSGNHPR